MRAAQAAAFQHVKSTRWFRQALIVASGAHSGGKGVAQSNPRVEQRLDNLNNP